MRSTHRKNLNYGRKGPWRMAPEASLHQVLPPVGRPFPDVGLDYGWPDLPTPLGVSRRSQAPYPATCLPDDLAGVLGALQRLAQCPPATAAAGLLGALQPSWPRPISQSRPWRNNRRPAAFFVSRWLNRGTISPPRFQPSRVQSRRGGRQPRSQVGRGQRKARSALDAVQG